MSFSILKSEPVYNYIGDTYRWSFYNVFDLQQYQMCTGEVRYVLLTNLRNPDVIFTTKVKDITKDELYELQTIIAKKLWWYFHTEQSRITGIFEVVNTLAVELEKTA